MNRLKECLETQAGRWPEGTVTPLGEGVWRVKLADVSVMLACAGGDCDLVCQADVGAFDGVSEKDVFLEDALRADFLWRETNGATLSVNPKTGILVLADRREADGFADGAELAAFLDGFAATVRKWRRYADNCSPHASGKAVGIEKGRVFV